MLLVEIADTISQINKKNLKIISRCRLQKVLGKSVLSNRTRTVKRLKKCPAYHLPCWLTRLPHKFVQQEQTILRPEGQVRMGQF